MTVNEEKDTERGWGAEFEDVHTVYSVRNDLSTPQAVREVKQLS